jgi:hypothetical protein
MIRTGKQNRHEKITVTLLSGKPVTPTEIADVFKGTDQEAVLYRLSTNIYNIRLDGGVIKVHKSGRSVTAYQLMNPQDFDANGRYIQKVAKQVKQTTNLVSAESIQEPTMQSVPKIPELIAA